MSPTENSVFKNTRDISKKIRQFEDVDCSKNFCLLGFVVMRMTELREKERTM